MIITVSGRRFRVAEGFDGPFLIELENFAVYGWRWIAEQKKPRARRGNVSP